MVQRLQEVLAVLALAVNLTLPMVVVRLVRHFLVDLWVVTALDLAGKELSIHLPMTGLMPMVLAAEVVVPLSVRQLWPGKVVKVVTE